MHSLAQNSSRVVLQGAFINGVVLLAIHRVGTQTAHEVTEDGVREQIQTRSVRKRRQTHQINQVADHHGINVGLVRGNQKNGSASGELFQMLHFTHNIEPPLNLLLLLPRKQNAGTRRVQKPVKANGERMSREPVDIGIEVAPDLVRVVLEHSAKDLTAIDFSGSPKHSSIDAPPEQRIALPAFPREPVGASAPNALPFGKERFLQDDLERHLALLCQNFLVGALDDVGKHLRAQLFKLPELSLLDQRGNLGHVHSGLSLSELGRNHHYDATLLHLNRCAQVIFNAITQTSRAGKESEIFERIAGPTQGNPHVLAHRKNRENSPWG